MATVNINLTGAALSRTDDTNVTLTLTGTPLVALLESVNIAVGWSGLLSTARGGTAVNIATTALTLGTASTTAGQLTLSNATNAFTQTIRGTNPVASITYDLPTTAPTLGQVLTATAPAAGIVTLSWATAAGGAGALSAITAATGTNTINNVDYAQTWNWDSADTESPLTLTANNLTTGSILSVTSSGLGVLNSTNGLLYVANTSADTGGVLAKFQANSTAGTGLTILTNGNVGVNVAAPAAGLSVDGNGYYTGSIGVGTTNSATTRLDVLGQGATFATFSFRAFNSASDPTFIVRNDGNVGIGTVSTDSDAGVGRTLRIENAGFGVSVGLKSTAAGGIHFELVSSTSGGAGYYGLWDGTANAYRYYVTSTGNIGIGTTTPTAYLHIKAGAAAASSAPLKFTSGTNQTIAEAGAMEYNGTNLFFTRSGTTREGVLTQSAVTTEVVVSDTTVTVNIGGVTYKLLARA